ncbi:hypothetical protein Ddye_004186 [Dipteronia dyeriana]|uniref:CCR4-NOT transcription complex subunit 1 CAF1-binding domain-containing protein n=1 Tax=Dipteronia dyeriana TaxID=168575 RepID=A0AAD9XUX3_9ROSI|nr:hypothetical protein Ddye_004186 [Dipteronia dyeriana]
MATVNGYQGNTPKMVDSQFVLKKYYQIRNKSWRLPDVATFLGTSQHGQINPGYTSVHRLLRLGRLMVLFSIFLKVILVLLELFHSRYPQLLHLSAKEVCTFNISCLLSTLAGISIIILLLFVYCRVVPIVMDKAIKEFVCGIVQLSVSIATQTAKELVLKAYVKGLLIAAIPLNHVDMPLEAPSQSTTNREDYNNTESVEPDHVGLVSSRAGSELMKSSLEECSLLNNLSSWLGKLTIGRNQVLRACEIDPIWLIIDTYEKGSMLAVIPLNHFVMPLEVGGPPDSGGLHIYCLSMVLLSSLSLSWDVDGELKTLLTFQASYSIPVSLLFLAPVLTVLLTQHSTQIPNIGTHVIIKLELSAESGSKLPIAMAEAVKEIACGIVHVSIATETTKEIVLKSIQCSIHTILYIAVEKQQCREKETRRGQNRWTNLKKNGISRWRNPWRYLSFNFYAAELMVKCTVRSASANDPTIPGKLLCVLWSSEVWGSDYRQDLQWKAPAPGFYKVKCSAVGGRGGRRFGVGIIIRNRAGAVMASCGQVMNACFDGVIAGIMAVYKGILFILDCGSYPGVFESDIWQVPGGQVWSYFGGDCCFHKE